MGTRTLVYLDEASKLAIQCSAAIDLAVEYAKVEIPEAKEWSKTISELGNKLIALRDELYQY